MVEEPVSRLRMLIQAYGLPEGRLRVTVALQGHSHPWEHYTINDLPLGFASYVENGVADLATSGNPTLARTYPTKLGYISMHFKPLREKRLIVEDGLWPHKRLEKVRIWP